jgi:N-carbamoyl-L-amino-acid hydrolase
MSLNPKRTVAELKELRELTADENGAQRVAWTDVCSLAGIWIRCQTAAGLMAA